MTITYYILQNKEELPEIDVLSTERAPLRTLRLWRLATRGG